MLLKMLTMFTLFLGLAYLASAQKILIDDYKIVLNNVKPSCRDTLTDYTRDDRKIVIQLADCMGKMYVKVYKNNRVQEEGGYINSLDTLKGYIYKNTLGGGGKEIVVEKYFQPLRDGVWLFYNQKGVVSRRINYIKGIQERE